ncbi:hypothetical protein DZG01_25960 [Pseudomonas fluorescens]|nr:hypothetical protein DZG01_25960 [Pseudomonas fluorescens]
MGQRRMQGSGRTDGVGAAGRVAADIRITIVVVKGPNEPLELASGHRSFAGSGGDPNRASFQQAFAADNGVFL